ncbi:P-loop containing nucleoside triphosphate hydrolase protein [Amniculicola lignicola CBS 123094]|uniref:P-loop containing nucleoside triphosphate hydrolase protein n=1 Tax=Amniculicola lignicola CBS 123094 TaxID=1392246 RepID=A0A6A5WBW7_9PLEO|nr:P-loop containing nucleoside triphosphate hydrolase protein [Amniculicola lignicola CBS 123094]
MADDEQAVKRLVGLTKQFNAVIAGKRPLSSLPEGTRFLEALCAQEDVSNCVERVVAAPAGLSAVAKAFRFSETSAFLNGSASPVLLRLSDPSLKQLHAGQFLSRVIEAIVSPPTFWNVFVGAHHGRTLGEEGTYAFAWLLLEMLYCHTEEMPDVREVAERITEDGSLINGSSLQIRAYGQKIKHILSSTSADAVDGAGGRHDNDHADFRNIKILPTPDEFASTDHPFYRRADAIDSEDPSNRPLMHLDNQFRLLREDFLGELRSDFQIARGLKKGRRKVVLSGLMFEGIDCGTPTRRRAASLKLLCQNDIPQLANLKGTHRRKQYLLDNRSFMKNQSFGCLVSGSQVIAFGTVERDEDMLSKEPPILVLRVSDQASFDKVLLTSKLRTNIDFVQVDTAVFAYEPILKRLQKMMDVPLHEQLLDHDVELSQAPSGVVPTSTVDLIQKRFDTDLRSLLGTPRSVKLDSAQAESLITGLKQKVSLIQGPPGTGKSFIGALLCKVLHDYTDEKILVQTYTNHALDQFLDDLQAVGIPSRSIVRLGQKFSASTKALSLAEQQSSYKMSRETYGMIQNEKAKADGYYDSLQERAARFRFANVTEKDMMNFLEFSEDSNFFDAFTIPKQVDGMTRVGASGKRVNTFYLLRQWREGKNAGTFAQISLQNYPEVWLMDKTSRVALIRKWEKEIIEERVAELGNLVQKYNVCQDQLTRLFRGKTSQILETKRIIGCTTTGAAMYTTDIQKASPGVVLVEEAGEILESHILTAMTANTKQLVLIGDHKQLRPKVNNYSLTVEKGDGYNLNQSLFERLVLANVPHTVLHQQHRMRPSISSLVRRLTYPELEDAPKTKGRPNLRGFQNDVIFVSHNEPEFNAERIADRREEGAKSSKENAYEVDMVLKCVRYLGQQGYGTDDLVILTPYLGQLYLLMKTLSKENDPVLNDLDSFELIRAGLLSPAGAHISKRKIRISTIDNYQGEESEIVIATLTRSNKVGDIGFMKAPERVNVLLSRARNALIMIGNADTFMESRKGREVWTPLMEQLREGGHVYDGFPVKCEQHPEKVALLTSPHQFDDVCPDGGCSEPCGKVLSCTIHVCPHRCHQLQDHSQMQCEAVVQSVCSQGHKISRKCHDKASEKCRICEAEVRQKERKLKRDHKLDEERRAKQAAYAKRLAEMEDEIEHQKRILKDQSEEQDRENVLAQKRLDLANLKTKGRSIPAAVPPPMENGQSNGKTPTKSPTPNKNAVTPASTDTPNSKGQTCQETNGSDGVPDTWEESESATDWDWQKKFEGAENQALDELMNMIGLESVKQQFLTIKAKVDTVVRQGVSLKDERFGAALLGNPGTGKTTVARLYASFLVEVGALPGSFFLETSGSSLANEGVTACTNHIDKILQAGGGVFFIDEAYQLVSGNSHGGKAVLDYLLAEMENLTGKIVFVLAGYRKQMEGFFAHNPGIPSRIPKELNFEDYTDEELQRILCHTIKKKYKGQMKLEDGMEGLYVRIVCRRIGRGRGREGFGNARQVQNTLSQITNRQATRLRRERKKGSKPDDNLLTKEDLIGPEPSSVLKNNAAWARLKKMIGLKAVKTSVQVLFDGIQYNYQRELEEKPIVQYSLNRCLIGSPGTGKTSIGKLYGRILADLGLLSNGEVIVKNPADFVGAHLGQSEANTKGILASTVGKVLIIDEAYMLAGGSKDGTTSTDSFKTAVIDTIVAEVQSTPGEDRCVLLLGYKDQMEEMFRDVNPGLARRFPLDSAFVFEDFTDSELRQILELKLKDVGFDATDQAKNVAMDMLQRARNQPNFGNAGEVDILLDKAKALHQKHMSAGKSKHQDTFDAIDFDPEFERGERAATNLPLLFKDVVGCDDLIEQLQGYQTTAANMKKLGMDPREQIPFNFLFKGPPGTGKTTTAGKMGKVFYDMGFLSQAKVVECSATDMIGQYIGHTGPKTKKLLEKALGKVLFIDEAYRLAEGHFATEAMDELVDCLTKPKFAGKLITILAGYDEDMNRLMSINPGLTSRFPETVTFHALTPSQCLDLLAKTLSGRRNKGAIPMDYSAIISPEKAFRGDVIQLFEELSGLKSWGNARDVKQLAKDIFGALISATNVESDVPLVLTEDVVLERMQSMLTERTHRNEAVGKPRRHGPKPQLPNPRQQGPPSKPVTTSSTKTSAKPPSSSTSKNPLPTKPSPKPKQATKDENPIDAIRRAKRDAGVSDEVWDQLQRDKEEAIAREEEYKRLQQEKLEEEQRIAELIKAEEAAADEERRKLEAERIQKELERRRREEVLAEIERRRKVEQEAQRKLMAMGCCPAGFHWIKQAGGWRCAGGSHFMMDQDLDEL